MDHLEGKECEDARRLKSLALLIIDEVNVWLMAGFEHLAAGFLMFDRGSALVLFGRVVAHVLCVILIYVLFYKAHTHIKT